jgi:hypothetical protein
MSDAIENNGTVNNFVETIHYSYDGKCYEIKVCKNNNGFSIRTLLNGKPANCFSYSINFTDFIGLVSHIWDSKIDPFKRLVEAAKSDIKDGYGIPLVKKI